MQTSIPDSDSWRVYRAFRDLTLPKPDWTHVAHLQVCWVALSDSPPRAPLDFLRESIRTYNEATGVANTATSGYHESITRYFVEAVRSVSPSTVDELVGHELCQRDAPLRFWTRDLLMSETARLNWVAPDLEPFPWHSTEQTEHGERASADGF